MREREGKCGELSDGGNSKKGGESGSAGAPAPHAPRWRPLLAQAGAPPRPGEARAAVLCLQIHFSDATSQSLGC